MPFKLVISKEVVPDFRHGKIFTVTEKYSTHLNYISLPIRFLKIDTRNITWAFMQLRKFHSIAACAVRAAAMW